MNEDWKSEERLEISDPKFSDTLNEHGERFKQPAYHGIGCPCTALLIRTGSSVRSNWL